MWFSSKKPLVILLQPEHCLLTAHSFQQAHFSLGDSSRYSCIRSVNWTTDKASNLFPVNHPVSWNTIRLLLTGFHFPFRYLLVQLEGISHAIMLQSSLKLADLIWQRRALPLLALLDPYMDIQQPPCSADLTQQCWILFPREIFVSSYSPILTLWNPKYKQEEFFVLLAQLLFTFLFSACPIIHEAGAICRNFLKRYEWIAKFFSWHISSVLPCFNQNGWNTYCTCLHWTKSL